MDGSTGPELRERVAVLRLALSREGRLTAATVDHLETELTALEARSDVEALVLSGTGGRFSTGADYADLVRLGAMRRLAALAERLESLSFPVVAAIEGPCIGAGAELVLAAGFRVVHDAALIAFDDALVGLSPAVGGTRRLPALVGADPALSLLLGGRRLTGREAQKLGLADLSLDGDVVAAAVDFVRELLTTGEAQPRRSDEDGASFLMATGSYRNRIAGAAVEAPTRILELVEAGRIVPIEIFRNMEEVSFTDLWGSEHARALMHIDGVERVSARLQRMIKPKAREVERVAVAGTRGQAPGLTIGLLDAGLDVTVADAEEETLEAGVTGIIEHYDQVAAAGHITDDQAEAVLDRLHALAGFRTVGEADVVFDVVNLRGAASKSLISQLDGAMKAGAVLATGSTQVGPDAIGAITSRPGDVVAVRFFGEKAERRAVEVTAGSATQALALGTVLALLRRMRRLPIVTAPNARGVGARMMAAVHRTADHLLEQGASVALIDGVARAWGLPMGSFAARDQHGIVAPSPKTAEPGAGLGLDRVLAAQGRRGVAVGRGYYLYENGQIAHDPEVAAMVTALRERKGITPRNVGADEIKLSLIAAMANAGAAVLREGALSRPDQLDLLSVHGLGLARRAGGVMHSADAAGLERVRARLAALFSAEPALGPPEPLFKDLLKTGRRLSDLNTSA